MSNQPVGMRPPVEREPLLKAEIEPLAGAQRAATLRLIGEIDISTEEIVADAFRTLAANGLTDVVVDARQVEFMDSTGLHRIVEGKRVIDRAGSKLVVVPSPGVARLLDLAFPEGAFITRVDTIDEALALIESG